MTGKVQIRIEKAGAAAWNRSPNSSASSGEAAMVMPSARPMPAQATPRNEARVSKASAWGSSPIRRAIVG